MFDFVLEILPFVLLVGGAALSIAAAVGLVRFSDTLTRLHAVTKPQVLGVMLVIAAIALEHRSWLVLFALLPVFMFQALTATVSAHMVGRASYRTGRIDRENLLVDELAAAVERAPETGPIPVTSTEDATSTESTDRGSENSPE